MHLLTPDELLTTYGRRSPEELAGLLGYTVTREAAPPREAEAIVFSDYRPTGQIILYTQALRALARQSGEAPARVEQWHIAHELYHALAGGVDLPWQARETQAALWADELLAVMGEAI